MQFINRAKQILKNMLLSACMAVSATALVCPVHSVAGTAPGTTVTQKSKAAPAKNTSSAKTAKKTAEKAPAKNPAKAPDNNRKQAAANEKKDNRKPVARQQEKTPSKTVSGNRSSAVASVEKQDSRKTQAKNTRSTNRDTKQPQKQVTVSEKKDNRRTAAKQQTAKAEPVQPQKKPIVEKPVIQEQTAQKGDIRSKPRDPRHYSAATKNAASKPSSGWTTSGVDTAAKSAYQERYADNVTPKVYAQTNTGKTQSTAPKEVRPAATVTSIEARSAVIDTTIFAAAQQAGIPDAITKKFTNLFSMDVDMDISEFKGSRFNLIYEVFRKDGKFVRTGNLLAAEFIHEGVHYQTIWFEKYTGQGEYYDVEGRSLKATATSMSSPLRTPLDNFRLSSGFGYRIHPIKGDLRAHKGLDMAAASGTPIHAAADGVVREAGWHGGYGNFVLIQHTTSHTSAYGHMSRIHPNITAGSHVRQGEIIGYVGSTGLSTGPHLHYEVRVNGIAQDPSKISGISGIGTRQNLKLSGNDLSRFKKHLYRMQSYFTQLNANPSKRISS